MSTPIDIGGGNQVTDYDATRIVVTPANGAPITMARSAAPPALQQAVARAEGAQALPTTTPRVDVSDAANAANVLPPVPAAPASAPLGIDVSDNATAAAVPVPEPQTPAANIPPAQPMQPLEQQPTEQYPVDTSATPQTVRTGGSSTSSTTTTKIPDAAAAEARGLQDDISAQRGAQGEAQSAQANVQSREAEAQAKMHGEQAALIEGERNAQVADAKAYDQAFEVNTKKLQELQQQAATEIDPKRFWHSKSTGEHILSAIALGIGTFGAGLARTQNTAFQKIDNAIQRDIDAQMANHRVAREQVGDQMNLIGMVANKYQTDTERRQAAYLLGRDAAAQQWESVGSQFKSEELKQQALADAAAFRAQTAQLKQEFVLKTAGQTTSSHSSTSTSAVVQGGATGAAAKDAQGVQFLDSVRRMAGEGTLKVVDGNALMTAYKTGRIPTKVYAELASAERLAGIRKAIHKTVDDYYNSPINSKEADAAQAKMVLLAADVKGQASAAKGSALDAAENSTIDNSMPVLERKIPRLGSGGFKTGRDEAHARASGAIDALTVPIEGNLRPFGMGLTNEQAPRPVSAPFKSADGRTYTMYSDGKARVD